MQRLSRVRYPSERSISPSSRTSTTPRARTDLYENSCAISERFRALMKCPDVWELKYSQMIKMPR
jgi:hypothetical protein